jgi:hypothetical protein
VLKKTITYTDFNDEEVSEDFFFHLSKAELVELEMSHEGGLSEALKNIVAAEDAKSIIGEFKNIILSAYGQRSEDGRRFIKNEQLREEFASSEAYSVLFMELVTDTQAAIDFINGIIPKGLAEEAAQAVQAAEDKQLPITPEGVVTDLRDKLDNKASDPESKLEPILITKEDIEKMSAEEISHLGERLTKGEIKFDDATIDIRG